MHRVSVFCHFHKKEVVVTERLWVEDVDKLHAEMAGAREALDSMRSTEWQGLDDDRMQLLARGLELALVASSASLGECRVERPFRPLYPLIDSSGNFKWCCTHPEPHCSS